MSEDALIVRDARETDLGALEWGDEYTHYRRVYRRTFDETRTGRRVMLLAEWNGELAGQVFLQLRSADPEFADGKERGYLYSLRVKGTYRGLGIGTRLLEAAEARLRGLRYREAVIAAAKSNPAARRLYERLGYEVFLEDPGQWSYIDHLEQRREVIEPCWVLVKRL